MPSNNNIYSLAFTRILFADDKFIIETETQKRYMLTTGISEYYILMNLARKVKQNGQIIIEIAEAKSKPVLKPIALIHPEGNVWITLTEDEDTAKPVLSDKTLLEPFSTLHGEIYADGFIDHTRTTLSYREFTAAEKTLHSSYYVVDLQAHYRRNYPGRPYDVRLHYPMIKGIRKHHYYTDDFLFGDLLTFYREWSDPFPWYLYLKTFGGPGTLPSFIRMRLMADNQSQECIPLAVKVLKSAKANARIRHYAILLAGLDEKNDTIISTFAEECPRAMLRLWHNRGSSHFYPMVLDNARRILDGHKDDIIDDLAETYMPDHNEYEQYVIGHRGYFNFDILTIEQVRELWGIYKQIALLLEKPGTDEMEKLRLGNAFRAFLMAVVYNATRAVDDILWDVYCNHNYLLYSRWSQDSHYSQNDIMWQRYLFSYTVHIRENFWEWLQHYARNYDSYYLYNNQCFFLAIYARIAYHVLTSATFYDVLSHIIDSNYVNVETLWRGITDDEKLPDDAPSLDHRWENMFLTYSYYTWNTKAVRYYNLVAHRIDPHPDGWTYEKFRKDLQTKKDTGVVVPL